MPANRCQRAQITATRLGLTHHHQGCSAIGDRAGIGRGHRSTLAESRHQAGNATRIDLQWCLVYLHLHTAATDPGTDRRQLLAEQPLLYGCLGTLYRLQRPGILLLATEAMALGTVF